MKKIKTFIPEHFLKLEPLLFIILLTCNLINIWSVNCYATMDGPAHLYNASLLNYYRESDFLQSYFSLNAFYLPNYLPHVILKELLLIFDPYTAEKLFLSVIVLFLPLSFRKMISLYTHGNKNLSLLIFPLVFSNLFNFGFFNLSLGFVLLNTQLILLYFILNDQAKWRTYGFFFINTLFSYYTHPFVFGITVTLVFLLSFIYSKKDLKGLIKRLGLVVMLYLPAIILFYLFFTRINVLTQPTIFEKDYTISEKIEGLYNFEMAVNFSHEEEVPYTRGLFGLFVFLIFFLLGLRTFNWQKDKIKVYAFDLFLLLAITLVPIILFAHNAWLSGALTARLNFLFFYFVIHWCSSNRLTIKPVLFLVWGVVLIIHLRLSVMRHANVQALNYFVEATDKSKKFIRNGSTVYLIKLHSNYLLDHFSNYAVIGKEVVINENYEAVIPWFPLTWKKKYFDLTCETPGVNSTVISPDYILIMGDLNQLNDQNNLEIKNFITSHYFQCYQSTYGFCTLFRILKNTHNK